MARLLSAGGTALQSQPGPIRPREVPSNDPERRPTEQLLELLSGHRVSQVIYVVATLGLAGLLATGPQTAAELAAQTGTHAGLRALAAAGVLEVQPDDRFALTPVGEALQAEAPSRVAAARLSGPPNRCI